MKNLSARGWLGHYFPALVLAAALPVFVAIVPTHPVATAGLGAGAPSLGGTDVIEGAGGAYRILPPPAGCFRKRAGFASCPNGFEGDNGGATYPGVTAEAINIVYYEPRRDEQVDASLAEGGAATTRDPIEALLSAWEDFANRAYQTYGRRINVIYQEGPGADSDPAAQQADATRAAVEDHAFAVIAEAATRDFHDELSRRGVTNISLLRQFEAEYYEQSAPYHWGALPDLDLITEHVAEYWCTRLMNQPAAHAGPGQRGQPRRLGIIHSESNDAGARLTRQIEACGGTVAKVSQYAGDITTATQQATNIIAQMRSANVTTVTCVCDPVAPIFFTSAAQVQGYNPEWLQNGYFATDSDTAGRLYDQTQWGRSFGPSSLSFPGPIAETNGWRAYAAARRGADMAPVRAAGYVYALFDILLGGIEAAGPNLNPQTFAEGLSNPAYYPAPTAPNEGAISYGSRGPSPYTAVDDMMEIWWAPDRQGPDGESGSAFYVESGRRRPLGGWPTGAPSVFSDDGSPQPARDPNQ